MNRKAYAKKIAYISVILVLVLVIIISGLRILESTVFSQQEDGEVINSGIYTADGVDYLQRTDVTVVLLLGIDERGKVTASESYNNTGEADMVTLLVFNETTKKCDILCLNRDTMLEMPALGLGGKDAGTFYGQLALAHTYGSGLKDSCKNTRTAVSDFLKGIEIDYYMALNMDAIALLNDAVGGVKVNVQEDFSDVDDTIPLGEHTLMGEQALHYVRVRKDIGDEKNISRMERQSEYMKGFLTAFKAANEQEGFALDTYSAVTDYMVTDFTTKSISNLLNRYGDYELGQILTPEGENLIKDGHYQFVADEKKLEKLVLQLFFEARA